MAAFPNNARAREVHLFRRHLLASAPAFAAAALVPSGVLASKPEALPDEPTRLELLHYAAFLRAENKRVSDELGIGACGPETWEYGGGFADKASFAGTLAATRALPVLRLIDAPILRGDLNCRLGVGSDVAPVIASHVAIRNQIVQF